MKARRITEFGLSLSLSLISLLSVAVPKAHAVSVESKLDIMRFVLNPLIILVVIALVNFFVRLIIRHQYRYVLPK